MDESQWDDKLRAFLKKTGDDLKRAGGDIRSEAERLMKEVKDEGRQEKVKKGLETFRVWAKKTAEEVATVVESGLKKAEVAVKTGAEKVGVTVDAPAPAAASQDATAAAPAEPMRHDTPIDTPAVGGDEAPKAAKKSMGGKKKAAGKTKAAGPKKPLGKKRGP